MASAIPGTESTSLRTLEVSLLDRKTVLPPLSPGKGNDCVGRRTGGTASRRWWWRSAGLTASLKVAEREQQQQ